MQYRMQAHDRRAVTRKYLDLPLEWHHRHPTGQLLSNANSDVEAAWGPIAPLPMAVGTVAMMVIAVVQMLLVDLGEKRIVPDEEIKSRLASAEPYARLTHDLLHAAGIATTGAAVMPLSAGVAGRMLTYFAHTAAVAPFPQLTERERDVLRELSRGATNGQIALALGLSAKTADRHIQNADGKAGFADQEDRAGDHRGRRGCEAVASAAPPGRRRAAGR